MKIQEIINKLKKNETVSRWEVLKNRFELRAVAMELEDEDLLFEINMQVDLAEESL